MTNHTSYNQDSMSVVLSKSFSQLVTREELVMWRVDWQPSHSIHTYTDEWP